MNAATHDERAVDTGPAVFARDGYLVVRALVGAPVLTTVTEHLIKIAEVGIFRDGDEQVPESPAKYAEPVVEEMLDALRPTVEGATGLSLFPTYSYVRLYKRGALLARHQDREACEISVTLNLATVPAEPWPIWIEGIRKTEAVRLVPGDALIYRGIDCAHWREPFAGEFAAQVFLHYVDQRGPRNEWKFDKRQALNA